MDDRPSNECFEENSRLLECDHEDKELLNANKKKNASLRSNAKVCPECGHVFKGNGWDGIDAHWKSKHDDIMPYEDAWPLLKSGTYEP